MQKQKIRPAAILILYFSLAALEALICIIYLLYLPADPKNQLIFGYSLPRLLIIGILLLLFIACSLLAVKTRSDRKRAEDRLNSFLNKKNAAIALFICSMVLFWIGWIISLTPAYRFGEFSTYYIRLQPVFIWLTLFCAQTILLLLVFRFGIHFEPVINELKASRLIFLAGSIPFLFGLLIWLAVAILGFKIVTDSIFWNETGVPILAIQVLLAWGVGTALILGSIFVSSHRQNWLIAIWSKKWLTRMDALVFILIWILAAVLWIREPMPPSYFSPGPNPPTYEHYPYSDAAVYDLSAQDALIGQKYSNGGYVDKPLYAAFLTVLHTLAGNNFDWTINLQVIVLALFPAILFLIGKAIFNRAIAIVVALLAIFQEINTIASTRMLQVSDTRLFLTEVPTALLLALFVLWIVRWFTQPNRRSLYLMLAGATLGLATLLRHNVLLLVPLAFLILLVNKQLVWKKRFQSILLFSAFIIISVMPWALRSTVYQHNPFYFTSAINGVVWRQRIAPLLRKALPKVKRTATPAPTLPTPAQAGAANLPIVSSPYLTPTPTKNSSSNRQSPSILVKQIGLAEKYITAHYLHNLITSTLILPSSLVNDDLPHLIQPAGSYWDINWRGSLTTGGAILLFINLGLIGLGTGLAWSKKKLAGWMPLVIFLVYNLATAVARTSGGRYIVPVEWVVYFYYAAGLVQVTVWFTALFKWDQNLSLRGESETLPVADLESSKNKIPAWQTVLVVLAILIFAASVPLLESVFPIRYTDGSQASLVSKMQQDGIFKKIQASGLDVREFVSETSNTLYLGRALYPTYAHGALDDSAQASPKDPPNVSRLEFTQIGPAGNKAVVLPVSSAEQVANFKNNSDVLIVGCQNNEFHNINAIAVVVLGASDTVYLRSPAEPLSCPVTEP